MSSEQWATRHTVAVNHILSSTLFIRLQTTIYSFSFFCSLKYSRTYRNCFIPHFNAARTIATCHYPIILSIIYAHSRALRLTITVAFRMQNGQTNWVRLMLVRIWMTSHANVFNSTEVKLNCLAENVLQLWSVHSRGFQEHRVCAVRCKRGVWLCG